MISLIRACPYFTNKTITQIEPLKGGLDTPCFKVTLTTQAVVCRIQQPKPKLAAIEHLQQTVATHLNLCPKVLYATELDNKQLSIQEFIDGQHQSAHLWPDRLIGDFATNLAKLHQLSHPGWPKLDFTTHINHYQQQLNSQQLSHFKSQINNVLHQLKSLEDWPKTQGLCHNDLNPLNIICQEKQIKLIDWDHAAISDIFFDLAGFVIEQQLTKEQSAHFYQDYLRSQNALAELNITMSDFDNKLEIFQQVYRLVCRLWHCISQHQEDISV